MGRGKGCGVTPELVRRLVADAVKAESQYAVAKKTGLALSNVQRILKGDREPTTATLAKLSIYFNVPIQELRGEPSPWDEVLNGLSDETRELLLEFVKKLSDEKQKDKYVTMLRQIVESSPSP